MGEYFKLNIAGVDRHLRSSLAGRWQFLSSIQLTVASSLAS